MNMLSHSEADQLHFGYII